MHPILEDIDERDRRLLKGRAMLEFTPPVADPKGLMRASVHWVESRLVAQVVRGRAE